MFKTVMNSDFIVLWPTIALVIFFCIMFAVILWVWRPLSGKVYEEISASIFENNEQERMS